MGKGSKINILNPLDYEVKIFEIITVDVYSYVIL